MRNFLMGVSMGLVTAVSPHLVHAVLDPDPDTIGIYFDRDATSIRLFAPAGVPMDAYVVLTNPTQSEIWGFEFSDSFTSCCDPTDIFRLKNELPPQSIDLGNSNNIMDGEYVVGMATPLPAQLAVVLVTWRFLMTDHITMELHLGPPSNPSLPENVPAYEAGGVIIPMYILDTGGGCDGNGDGTVSINLDCGLPTEGQSFGGIKALYR